MTNLALQEESFDTLVDDLRLLIGETRQRVAVAVNAGLTLLYWNIGSRIRQELLKNERAEYGEQIVATVSRQLSAEYGKGFARANLFHMLRFSEVFPDIEIVSALSRQLGWTHFRQIIYVKDGLARDFYAEMCRIERWSTRTLSKKIDSMLFERTAISKKSDELIKQEIAALQGEDRLTPDLVFRDPYFLEFLNLADTYSEKDLERAILREIERFLLELGSDFAFVARQKRITVDGEDYYLDLLFYHRKLRRLILIELKIGKLKAADAGQVELYLRWLDKYERQTGEDSPMGLILCAEKGEQMIELLELEQRGVRVAEYLTELPPREILERKIIDAVRIAKSGQENR